MPSRLQAPGPAVDVFSIEVGGIDLRSTLCQLLSFAPSCTLQHLQKAGCQYMLVGQHLGMGRSAP